MAQLIKNLTQAKLKEILEYNPETGVFTWLIQQRGTARVGSKAGTPCPAGYCQISIKGKRYLAHRLAFLYMTGDFPKNEVDHINRDNTDNSWKNLRNATRSQNEANTRLFKTNKSGYRGVSWDKHNKCWKASGKINNKSKHIGCFSTVKKAHLAACKWRKENFGNFAMA
jgi:hypothetical protein